MTTVPAYSMRSPRFLVLKWVMMWFCVWAFTVLYVLIKTEPSSIINTHCDKHSGRDCGNNVQITIIPREKPLLTIVYILDVFCLAIFSTATVVGWIPRFTFVPEISMFNTARKCKIPLLWSRHMALLICSFAFLREKKNESTYRFYAYSALA